MMDWRETRVTDKSAHMIWPSEAIAVRDLQRMPNPYELSAGQGKETYFPELQRNATR